MLIHAEKAKRRDTKREINKLTYERAELKGVQVKFYVVAVALLLMVGCSKDPQITSPNEVVESYFKALYNERDFAKALSFASAHHQTLLNSYGTPASVGRYLYNMSYEHIDIQAERPSGVTYMNNPNSLRISVLITGYSQGQRADELFEVIVVFEDEGWKVDWKLDSPY